MREEMASLLLSADLLKNETHDPESFRLLAAFELSEGCSVGCPFCGFAVKGRPHTRAADLQSGLCFLLFAIFCSDPRDAG